LLLLRCSPSATITAVVVPPCKEVTDQAQVLANLHPIGFSASVEARARDETVYTRAELQQPLGFACAAIEIAPIADAVSELARSVAKLGGDLIDVIFAARAMNAAVVERAVQMTLKISTPVSKASGGVA
jgi:hypothetical protein